MTTLSYSNGAVFNQTFPDINGQRPNLTGTVFSMCFLYFFYVVLYLSTFPYTFFKTHTFSSLLLTFILDKDSVYPALFPNIEESHGGDDVGIFATGNGKCVLFI